MWGRTFRELLYKNWFSNTPWSQSSNLVLCVIRNGRTVSSSRLARQLGGRGERGAPQRHRVRPTETGWGLSALGPRWACRAKVMLPSHEHPPPPPPRRPDSECAGPCACTSTTAPAEVRLGLRGRTRTGGGSEVCPDSLFPEPSTFLPGATTLGKRDRDSVREGTHHWKLCAHLKRSGSHWAPQVPTQTPETEAETMKPRPADRPVPVTQPQSPPTSHPEPAAQHAFNLCHGQGSRQQSCPDNTGVTKQLS